MKHVRKPLALVLTLVMLLPLAGLALNASAATTYTPIIRVHGENTLVWRDENGTEHQLYDDDEYVNKIVDECLPLAATALVTGNWSKWSEKALAILKPAYEHYQPAPDGTVQEDSYIVFDREMTYEYRDPYSVEGSYEFFPDYRKPVLDEADRLNEIIEHIKAVTGRDKVTLVGQCMGCCYMLAYLYKYQAPIGYSGIDSVLFSTTTSNGLIDDDLLMSGNFYINGEIAYKTLSGSNVLDSVSEMAGGMLLELILKTLELLYLSKPSEKLTAAVINRVYKGVKNEFIAPLIQEYYGRCGGYVTAVNEHYDEYRDYVFPTKEDRETFAVILEKSDEFHYNIQSRQVEMIREMQTAGVYVACISQYGLQSTYVAGGEAALETSDGRVPVSKSSFGAAGVKVGEKLSDEYVAAREAEGLGKYISPDREVDASTGFMRDTTWYIRNAGHMFDTPVMNLATAIVRHPGATVDDLEAQGWVRFLNYTDPYTPLAPAQETNPNDQQPATPEAKNGFDAFIRWLRTLISLIKSFLKIGG